MVTIDDIRRAMRGSRMTARALAEQAGLNYEHLCKVLKGNRPAVPGLIAKCATALGMEETGAQYRDVIAVAVRFAPDEFAALKSMCADGQTPEDLIRELIERESAREVADALTAADHSGADEFGTAEPAVPCPAHQIRNMVAQEVARQLAALNSRDNDQNTD